MLLTTVLGGDRRRFAQIARVGAMALSPHHMKQFPILHLGMVLLLASACSSVPCAFAAQQPHPHAGAGVTEGEPSI